MPAKPNSWGLALSAYVAALGVVILDQLSKYWILEVVELETRGSIPVLPFFKLSMVWNRGVSFGLFQSPSGQETIRWILAAFAALMAIALAVIVRKATRRLPALAIGLIIGGAVGNLVDRVRFGAVVDFLDFSALHFPWVFNIADSAINVGVALILFDTFRNNDKSRPTL